MPRKTNQHLRKAIELSRRLSTLADHGEACCQDDGCGVLYGVIRDCAYKIRGMAERERDAHIRVGKQDSAEGTSTP